MSLPGMKILVVDDYFLSQFFQKKKSSSKRLFNLLKVTLQYMTGVGIITCSLIPKPMFLIVML